MKISYNKKKWEFVNGTQHIYMIYQGNSHLMFHSFRFSII
jgi:hypothetical protein